MSFIFINITSIIWTYLIKCGGRFVDTDDYLLTIIICTSNYANPKEIEKELGGAIYNRFDNIIHYEDLSNEAKTIIGDKLYEEYQKRYRMTLDSVIEGKLKEAYSRCENVRQISRLIEDTFAQISVMNM